MRARWQAVCGNGNGTKATISLRNPGTQPTLRPGSQVANLVLDEAQRLTLELLNQETVGPWQCQWQARTRP